MKTNLVAKENHINENYNFMERIGAIPDDIPLPQKIPVPQKNKKPQLQKIEKTKEEILKYQEKQTNKKAIKFASVMFAFFLMFVIMCNSFVVKNDTRRSLENVKEEYDLYVVAQEEVDTKIDSILVKYDINTMATNKFGMIKVSPANTKYIINEKNTENKIIYSKD